MGKKRKPYDKENLALIADFLGGGNKLAIENGGIDLDSLEKKIQEMPKKFREPLEKYYGLIPGTINWSVQFKKNPDLAFRNLLQAMDEALFEISKYDYAIEFDFKLKEISESILKKVNRSGTESLKDNDIIKYILVWYIFVYAGKDIAYQNKDYKPDVIKESLIIVKVSSMLYEIWKVAFKNIPDGSFNLNLLVETIEQMPEEQKVEMHNWAFKAENASQNYLKSIHDIRSLKERMFPKGEWTLLIELAHGTKKLSKEEKEALEAAFYEICKNWKNVENYKKEDAYYIGSLRFLDQEEIFCLYSLKEFLE